MNFEDYREAKDIKNYGKVFGKISQTELMHVITESPDNITELMSQIKTGQSQYEFRESHKIKTTYFINSDDNEGLTLTACRVITVMPFEKNRFKKGVVAMSQKGDHRLIIYPFLRHISFNKVFNAFK
ncbi:MAG: hypothetical protein GQ574_06565 [Crocinitomix sp.]|nr:hypothetical protein [Crocinitomix sp.]